jgi:pilus assembly protein Flp/PilA
MPPSAGQRREGRAAQSIRNVNPRKDHLMSGIFSRFVRDDSGATAIEYGLIAGLIAVVVVTSITTLGTKLTNTFNNVSNKL